MAATNAQQIAVLLRDAIGRGGEAYAQALASCWDEQPVDVTHEPPLPMDRPMDRAAMLTERRQLDSAFAALMPDFKYDNIYSRVVGDVIYLFCDQVGTLAAGTAIRSPLCSRFTVDDGRIKKVVLGIDPVSVAPLHRAFTELAAAEKSA